MGSKTALFLKKSTSVLAFSVLICTQGSLAAQHTDDRIIIHGRDVQKGTAGPGREGFLLEPNVELDLPVDPTQGCPGFYIASVELDAGAQEGGWSMEIKTTAKLQGGLNLGGAVQGDNGRAVGFAAFNVANSRNEPQRVDISVEAQALAAGSLSLVLQVFDSARNPVADPVSGAPPLTTGVVLNPGFYIVRLSSAAGAPHSTFQMALSTRFVDRAGGAFQGGVNVGGFLTRRSSGASVTGFAAFCIAEARTARIRTISGGAGDLILRVKDRNREPIYSSKITEIVLEPEIPVAVGGTVQLDPLIRTDTGNTLEPSALNYSSLDTQVAGVDAAGLVTGRKEGFSTLIATGGDVLATATIVVGVVVSGSAGFEATSTIQDPGGRLFLANRNTHTILMARDLDSTPATLAGLENVAGFVNGSLTESRFNEPSYLAMNRQTGTLYVSDAANHVIRSVSRIADEVDTLAGTGTPGAANGDAGQAEFNTPQGIALDETGNLWVADSGNHTIRRINLFERTVETIAGSAGAAGFQDGIGTQARFNSPRGITIDVEPITAQLLAEKGPDAKPAVRVIVADTGNGVVRTLEQDAAGNWVVTTLDETSAPARGGGLRKARAAAVFSSPTGVAIDAAGNLYVSEPEMGKVTTILQNGGVVPVGQSGLFSQPSGITVNRFGSLLVADQNRSSLEISYAAPEITLVLPERVPDGGGTPVTILGRNFAPESQLVVADVVVEDYQVEDTGTIRFTSPKLANGRTTITVRNRGGLGQTSLFVDAPSLQQISQGQITTVAGGDFTFKGDGFPARQASLKYPLGVAVDAGGNLFIADALNNRIRRVDIESGIITTVAGTGCVATSFSATRCEVSNGVFAVAANLSTPLDLIVDAGGNLFLQEWDGFNTFVRRVDAQTGLIDASSDRSFGISAFDAAGNRYTPDPDTHRVTRTDAASGTETLVAGTGTQGFSGDGGQATSARLNTPWDVALDGAGNLYIADSGNNRVRRVDLDTGIITTVAGSEDFLGDGGLASAATLRAPTDVITDGEGNIYIADLGHNRVRRVDAATGIISTVAGSGCDPLSSQVTSSNPCRLGDGGPATDAALSPFQIALDYRGDLYIADIGYSSIRKVRAATGIITTVAGTGCDPSEGGCSRVTGRLATESPMFPVGVAVDGQGNLFISDLDLSQSGTESAVLFVDVFTELVSTLVSQAEDNIGLPLGLSLSGRGDIFLASTEDARVLFPDETRTLTLLPGWDAVWAAKDEVFMSLGSQVWNLTLNPVNVTVTAGSGCAVESENCELVNGIAATQADLFFATSVAVDPNRNLLIAEADGDRIRVVRGGAALKSQDDHGNDCTQATTTRLNTDAAGTLDGSGDVDTFRIFIPAEGSLTLSTSGAATLGRFYWCRGPVFGEDLDLTSGSDWTINSAFEYYLDVYGSSSGSYTLRADFSTDSGITVETHLTTTDPLSGSGCQVPAETERFANTEPAAWLWFSILDGELGDLARAEWFDPKGELYHVTEWDPLGFTGGGCFFGGINVAGTDAALRPGPWLVVAYLNDVEVFVEDFEIQPPGVTILDYVTTRDPLAGSGCQVPAETTIFSTGDPRAYIWFLVSEASQGDLVTFEFFDPAGGLYATVPLDPIIWSGGGCFWAYIGIDGFAPASQPGRWRAKVRYNGADALARDFVIQ